MSVFTSSETRQLCTFYVDNLYFGIDVLPVQEVIRHQQLSRVPLAPSAVSGLINLRGQIVTAIDLRKRLNLPPRNPFDWAEEHPLNVVVHREDAAVSLQVDQIGDVVHVEEDAMEAPPPTLDPVTAKLTECVYKLPDKLLLVLDIEETLAL